LSDCLKIASGLSCLLERENKVLYLQKFISPHLTSVTDWSSLAAWLCWEPCHHLIVLKWGMTNNYLGVHLYSAFGKYSDPSTFSMVRYVTAFF
jgi:hypothetical protein